jgi:hypothetical protein
VWEWRALLLIGPVRHVLPQGALHKLPNGHEGIESSDSKLISFVKKNIIGLFYNQIVSYSG